MYDTLGFTKNLFFTESLGTTKEDLDKFVGRRNDVHRYLAQISGREGCVHLVTGNPGVGKTSFVNVMQYVTSVEDPKSAFGDIVHTPNLLIPSIKKLQINSDDTAQSVMLKITSSLIFSLISYYEHRGLKLPRKIDEHHKRINELIVSTGKPSGSVSVMGSGGSYGGETIGYEGTASTTVSHLSHIINELLHVALPDLNMNGIYVVINNLDIVEHDTLVKILNELRDELFAIKELWIILLGSKGTYAAIKQHPNGARLVDNFRGTETFLGSLNEVEAADILRIRATKLSFDESNPRPLPVSEQVIREIYKHCDGEIRFLFNVCDQIVRSVLTKYPSLDSIDNALAFSALKPIVQEEIRLDSLGKKQLRMLTTLLEKPLRPKDYKEVKLTSAPDFSNVAKDLLKRNLVRKREEGVAVYYEPSGQVVLARYCELI